MKPRAILVSILINNYNYGRFLHQAIDSALAQTYGNVEVIVVDDGSTDDSRDIVASYGSRLTAVFKKNGGQASAFNAGIAASRGEVICMLDADDLFHPDKVERVIPYSRPGTMIYHRLQLQPGPGTIPEDVPPRMDYYRFAQHYRFVPYGASPTSGLVISRDLALRLVPLPKEHVYWSADDFIVRGAGLIGDVVGITDVLATYRVHGENAWYGKQLPKSREFMEQLENYLNGKLVEAGKAPVIDFYNSIFAREFIPQTAAALSRLALSVFGHHASPLTLKFMLKTLARAASAPFARGLDAPMRNGART